MNSDSSYLAGAPAVEVSGSWVVTYFNPLTGKRHVLIDDINESIADATVRKFGAGGDPFCRLSDVHKESAAAPVATGAPHAE